MKKCVFFILISAFCLLLACNNTDSKALSSDKQIDDFSDVSRFQVHTVDVDIKFNYGGWNIKVFDSPFLENEIYTLQKNDEVHFTQYVTVIETDITSVKAEIKSGIQGYIRISNPYKNAQFSHKENIVINNKEVEILNFNSTFCISEETEVKALPTDNSENLHRITHKEGGNYYQSCEITADYKWVKMRSDSWSGWVPAKALSRDIGGPAIYTPEIMILWELYDSNLI